MKLIFLFIVAFFSMSFLGCGKNCKDPKYSFSMEESFYPENDSINVGDTIFINCTHLTTFIDLTKNLPIDFSNSQISVNIEILTFPDSSQNAAGAVNDFDIVNINGTQAGNDNLPGQNRGFYFEEIDNSYMLKVKFIAKQRGVYGISVSNSLGIVQRKGSCEKATIEIDNRNLNNHLYMYQNFRPGYQISEFERTHLYCFKVK